MKIEKIHTIEPLDEKEYAKLMDEKDSDMHVSTIDKGLTDEEINYEVLMKLKFIENLFKKNSEII